MGLILRDFDQIRISLLMVQGNFRLRIKINETHKIRHNNFLGYSI